VSLFSPFPAGASRIVGPPPRDERDGPASRSFFLAQPPAKPANEATVAFSFPPPGKAKDPLIRRMPEVGEFPPFFLFTTGKRAAPAFPSPPPLEEILIGLDLVEPAAEGG